MTPTKRRRFVLMIVFAYGLAIGVAVALLVAPTVGVALLVAVLVLSLGSDMAIAVRRSRRKGR
jgi:hypothetical protein